MLITELSTTQWQALSKEIRRFVENDKTHSDKIVKEAELRKFLVQKNMNMLGISDVEKVLSSHYNSKTTSRILSKLQKSVVLDTCICNLSISEIEKLVLEQDFNFIITTAIFREIVRLSKYSDEEVDNVQTARKLLDLILSDSESTHFTVVDVPTQDYTDNQLISYCKENDYLLYTCDYILGLRARVRNINTKIFLNFDTSEIKQYVPNPAGKNIILCKDIICDIPLNNVIAIATEMGLNKFILTDTLIEDLEKLKKSVPNNFNSDRFNEWIHFFVVDDSNNYLILSECETKEPFKKFVEENNAIIFSHHFTTCMQYKMDFIPYKFINRPSQLKFSNTLTDKLNDAIATKQANVENVKNIVVDINNTNAIIPYYKAKDNILSLSNVRENEQIFVIDQFGSQVKPNNKNEIALMPKYRVVYFNKLSKKTERPLKITVFNLINSEPTKYSNVIYSAYFRPKEDCLTELPKEYALYAKKVL